MEPKPGNPTARFTKMANNSYSFYIAFNEMDNSNVPTKSSKQRGTATPSIVTCMLPQYKVLLPHRVSITEEAVAIMFSPIL